MFDPDDQTFSTPEACRMAGVTYRQVDYWVREGLVSPVVRARGSGTTRRFDSTDVLALALTRVLLGRQVPHSAIRSAQGFLGTSRDFLWVQGETVGVGDEWDLGEAVAHVPETVLVNLRTLRAGLGLDPAIAA